MEHHVEDIPQPGESSAQSDLADGSRATIMIDGRETSVEYSLVRSESLTLENILHIGGESVPYYRDVYEDVLKGDDVWPVTKKVKEYADYLRMHPDSLETMPPIHFLDGKLKDGAHRISALYLLAHQHPDSSWPGAKLPVDFFETKVRD